MTGEAHNVETDASGYAYFVGDSEAGEIRYTLEVDYLCNATQAHIHLGGADEDGPVVAWLYPEEGGEAELVEGRFDGVLAEGVLIADNLVGEWEGASIEAAKAAFDEEDAYVNIHTEDHPGGEIRGQIRIINSL